VITRTIGKDTMLKQFLKYINNKFTIVKGNLNSTLSKKINGFNKSFVPMG